MSKLVLVSLLEVRLEVLELSEGKIMQLVFLALLLSHNQLIL